MGILLVLQTLLCTAAVAVAFVNACFFRRIRRRPLTDAELPFISVCIPARNEAQRIEPCLRSLARQDYPRFEVLALDDCSEDETAARIEAIALREPVVRLIRGRPLPEGWFGKNFACHQLGREARGDVLFFTDADTIFKPGCLRHLAEVAKEKNAELVTGLPRLIADGFWERLTVPLLGSIFISSIPSPWIESSRFKGLACGSGAFLFFDRAAYDAIGGHGSVRDHIVEDIMLCRAIKAHGFRIGLADAPRYVSCRMYESFGQIWEGMTKNIAQLFGLSPIALSVPVAYLWLTQCLPWIWFMFGPSWGWPPWASTLLPLIQIASAALARSISDRLTGRPDILALLLAPVSTLLFTAMAIGSASRVILRQPTPWRGRHYAIWKDRKGEIEPKAARGSKN